MFRHGVVTELAAAGHAVATPSDVLRWAARRRGACILLSVRAEADWELLRSLAPDAAVIALLDDASAIAGVRAVRAGARSVVPRAATGSLLRRTVEATIDGQAVLPPEVLPLLAAATTSAAAP